VGVEQPKAKKRALQNVTYSNLPSSTLKILDNVPLTVNQPPIKRSRFHLTCSCPYIQCKLMRKVQQRVDHVAQELIQHTVESQVDEQASQQPQNDEASGQMPYVQQTMAQVAQKLIQHTVIPLVDQQADEQPRNEDAGHMQNVPKSKIGLS
ncbi:Uncharacterized protein APZ42_003714, partial [Daphnia magna]